jgi:hypothetical protein
MHGFLKGFTMAKRKAARKAKYQYRPGRSHPGIPAEVVGKELERIRHKNGGRLDAPAVVRESKPKAAVLHKQFPWDVKKAAAEHWLSVARNIINVVEIVYVSNGAPSSPVPAFVNIISPATNSEERDRQYEPIGIVMADDAKKQILLKAAKRELDNFRKKYGAFQELSAIWDAVDQVFGEEAA